jgi:hypothetical protein
MIRTAFFGCAAAVVLAAVSVQALAGGPAKGVGIDGSAYASANKDGQDNQDAQAQLAQLNQQLKNQSQQVALAQATLDRAQDLLNEAKRVNDLLQLMAQQEVPAISDAKRSLALAQSNLASGQGSAAVVAQAQNTLDNLLKDLTRGQLSSSSVLYASPGTVAAVSARDRVQDYAAAVAAGQTALNRAQQAVAQTQAQITALHK